MQMRAASLCYCSSRLLLLLCSFHPAAHRISSKIQEKLIKSLNYSVINLYNARGFYRKEVFSDCIQGDKFILIFHSFFFNLKRLSKTVVFTFKDEIPYSQKPSWYSFTVFSTHKFQPLLLDQRDKVGKVWLDRI